MRAASTQGDVLCDAQTLRERCDGTWIARNDRETVRWTCIYTAHRRAEATNRTRWMPEGYYPGNATSNLIQPSTGHTIQHGAFLSYDNVNGPCTARRGGFGTRPYHHTRQTSRIASCRIIRVNITGQTRPCLYLPGNVTCPIIPMTTVQPIA